MTVRVLGVDYEIIYEKTDGNTLKKDDLWGLINHRNSQIIVDEGLATGPERETILHEIFHACDKAAETKMTEEELSSFSAVVFAVMADNPDVMMYIATGAKLRGQDEDDEEYVKCPHCKSRARLYQTGSSDDPTYHAYKCYNKNCGFEWHTTDNPHIPEAVAELDDDPKNGSPGLIRTECPTDITVTSTPGDVA
jgi:DNA-directed RNA polymerase subunit M/transcription elongation factor TFIIS